MKEALYQIFNAFEYINNNWNTFSDEEKLEFAQVMRTFFDKGKTIVKL